MTRLRCVIVIAGIAALFAATASAAFPPYQPMEEIKTRLTMGQVISAYQKEAAMSQAHFAAMEKRLSTAPNRYGDYEILHTLLAFEADEATGVIETVTTLQIKALDDGISQVDLSIQVLDEYTVEDGEGTVLEIAGYVPYAGLLTVNLETPLDTGDEMELVVKNSGDPHCEPDEFFGMQFCGVTEAIVFFTGVDWMPTRPAYVYADLYSDSFIDIDITTPYGYVAATTSDPDSVEDTGDELIHHFVGHFGSTYMGMAYAPYETFTMNTQSGVPVTAFVHQGDTGFADDWADICADIVNFYERVYSPYIYNKHSVVQTVEALGGGVGPQSASFYYASAFGADPVNQFPSESIFSHEIAHSWWGNIIRLGANDSPWINEGFAEYSSRLYGFTRWPEYYQNYLYEMYFKYFLFYVDPSDEVSMSGNDIFSVDSFTYQAITYWKGSHFLRMLQWKLGDEDFFSVMSAYANTYASDNSDELATPGRFRQVLEDETGENFAEFFDQWVYGIGYPIYSWAAQFDQTKAGYTARVRIEQIQDSTQIYDLPLEVEIFVGEQEEPEKVIVAFDGKVADETFTLTEQPRGLRVDEAYWVWGDKRPALVGDIDGSNEVDGLDFIYISWAFGGDVNDYDSWNYITDADFNRDGVIDDADLSPLTENFGKKGQIND